MDDSFVQLGYETGSTSETDSSDSDNSPPPQPEPPRTSGIKLVLPSLKSLQAAKAPPPPPPPVLVPEPEPVYAPIEHKKSPKQKKKPKKRQKWYTGLPDDDRIKVPRPLKLKPLKEVLTRLIAQIKRKDDYAFFLHPVDVSKIPGYSDIVKRPMDFGTMSVKVQRGKYRSLEEFTDDFRLVTSNAKAFNGPDSIYSTEADRIEAWGMEHITKAAATVVQYETSWDIDVVKDDDESNAQLEDDESYHNSVQEPGPSRETSVFDFVPGRRTTRAAVQQKRPDPGAPGATQGESIDAEGRLPGSKDGLGAFPPGSDWAKMMLALKLKGKKYKTKKERLRVEKEGPPYRPDGSLAYTELEDPFTILSALVPDSLTRPSLTPLYSPRFLPPPPAPPQVQKVKSDRTASQTPQPQSQPPPSFPLPVTLDPDRRLPVIQPDLVMISTNTPNSSSSAAALAPRRKHWVIAKSIPARSNKAREEEPVDMLETNEAWKTPREPHAVDFGSLAYLSAKLAEEINARKDPAPRTLPNTSAMLGADEPDYAAAEQKYVFDVLRESLEPDTTVRSSNKDAGEDDYWCGQRAAESEDYLRDVVYGGVEGYAYVRSLAEFVRPVGGLGLAPVVGDVPLATWVERSIVDPLTAGRHSVVSRAAEELRRQVSAQASAKMEVDDPAVNFATASIRPHMAANDGELGQQVANPPRIDQKRTISSQVSKTLQVYPDLTRSLVELVQVNSQKIDMAALIKSPQELFISEEVWVGRSNATTTGSAPTDADGDVEMKDEASSKPPGPYQLEDPAILNRVLQYTADSLAKLDRRLRSLMEDKMKTEDGEEDTLPPDEDDDDEDVVLRDLRLNLLALAKRAPLDTLAKLPMELVPAHIRHYIPSIAAPG